MVAIVSGAGLGLLDTSANQLNGAGVLGSGTMGQARGNGYVNLATGNLILQFTDETLAGTGADIRHLRTYNSLGVASDGDNDRWRWLGEKRVTLSGILNAVGSKVIRTSGDGHGAEYFWDADRHAYVTAEGSGADDTIVRNGSEWVWTEGSSKFVERYDSTTGWIKHSRDTSGNGFDYVFTNDLLTRITDARSGQTLELHYTNNRVSRVDTRSSVTGAATQQVHYAYDNNGRLTQVTTDLSLDNSISDNHTYITTYTYDGSSHRIKSISQSDGTSVHYTYINSGGEYKIRTVTDQSGVTTFTYNTNNTEVKNGEGETTIYFYDSQQRLIRVNAEAVNGNTQSVQYAYDSKDNVIKVTDGKGEAITYTYDNNSNLIKEVDALGNTVERTYINNQLVTETHFVAGEPQTTRFVYDASERLRYTISAEGNVSETRYNAQGLIVASIQYSHEKYPVSGLSKTATLSESQLNSWVANTDRAQTQLSRFEYNHLGQRTRQFNYGIVDSHGNGVLNTNTSQTEYVYSAYGELLQTIAVTGASRTKETQLESRTYDGLGRVMSVVNESGTTMTSYGNKSITVSQNTTGLTVTRAFDSQGRLLSVTSHGEGENRITRNYYDEAGRLVMVQNAVGDRSYILYDDAGRVSHRVSELGAVVGYIYDENGRITEERRYHNTVNTSDWFDGSLVIQETVTQKTLSVSVHGDDRITRYAYDKVGRLITTTEEFGSADRITTNTYDSASQVISTTLGGDRTTQYFYDKDGRVQGTLNAENYLSENIYDHAGRLIRTVRYPAKVVSTTANFDVMRSEANKDNLTTTGYVEEALTTYFFYDSQGRQVGVVNEQGYLNETVFDVANRKSVSHQYLSVVDVIDSDTLAAVKARSGIKQTTTTTFDTYGRVDHVVTHDGTKTRNIYDAAGRLIKTIVAEGTTDQTATRTRYNSFSEVTGTVSGVGEAAQSDLNIAIDQYGTEYTYDLQGRRISESGPQGQKNLFFYNKEGRLSYVVNGLGEVSETLYNTFGQTQSIRVLSNRISLSGLVGGSETTALINRVNSAKNNQKDQRTITAYNLLGEVDSVTDGLGRKTTYQYNRYGDLTDVLTPFSGSHTTLQRYTYDKLGRVTTSTENYHGSRAQTGTFYDGFGRVYRASDANDRHYFTDYLHNGRVVVQVDPLNRKRSTRYDAFGREVETIDANGQKTIYAFNDSNRTLTVTTPEGISITTWTTRTGQTLQVRDGNNLLTKYTYDKDNNLKTVTNGLGQVTTNNTYDKSGRLYETKDANGNVVRLSYDAANRIVQRSTDPNGLNIRTRYTFDGLGQTLKVESGYGMAAEQETQYIYDAAGQLKQEIIDPNGLKLSTRYSYDDAGNQTRVERGTTASPAQQVVQYHYNQLGQRTVEVLDPGGLNIITLYRYDKNGNLTRMIDANNRSTWYIYNVANEKIYDVNALGHVKQYEYDANGNVAHIREYVNKVNVTGWGDEREALGSNLAAHAKDRRTYTIRDENGRERFSVTSVDENQWVATESVLDKNGNIIESRRFDRYLTTANINSVTGLSSSQKGVITEAEIMGQLRGKGYRSRAWGDSSDTLFSTRRTHFSFDAANRLRFTVDATGHLSENSYDGVGNLRFQRYYALKPNSLGGNYSENNIQSRKRSHSDDRITEYQYDKANRLQFELSSSVTVKASNGVTYTGRLKKQTFYDALGQVVKFEEGTIDRATSSDIITDRRTIAYSYDKAGNQIKTVLAGWYDTTDQKVHRVKSNQADRFQRTVEVQYDALGNAVRNKIRTGIDSYVYQYKAYDAIGRELFDIDGEGYVSGKTYDALGNIVTETRYNEKKNGSVPVRGYWSAAEISSDMASDTKERVISHTYNALGQKTKTLLPTVSNYTSSGSTTAKNPAATSSSTLYDAAPETRFEYNVFGEIVRERVRHDKTRWADTYTFYDNIGRATLTVDPARYGTVTEYNSLGDVVTTREYYNRGTGTLSIQSKPEFATHKKDRIQHFTYDAMGRVTQVRQEQVTIVTQNASSPTYSGETTATRTLSTTAYNAFGETRSEKNGLNHETRYLYDRVGNAVKVTGPQRRVASKQLDPFRNQVNASYETDYTYDVFGNVRDETRHSSNSNALGVAITNSTNYDHAGYTVRTTDGNGHRTDYRVDVNGNTLKQTQVAFVTGSQSQIAYTHTIERRFEYDKVGRQTVSLDVFDDRQSGSRQLYNAFGEVIREDRLKGQKNLASSNLTRSSFKFYSYDNTGRVTFTRGSEGYTHFFYDLRGNVTRQEHRGTTNNAEGARATENYYDILGRTIIQRLPYHTGTNQETRVDPTVLQHHDRWGNVLSRVDANNQATHYTYNHNNQVVTERTPNTAVYRENNTAYTGYVIRVIAYDAAGRLAVERQLGRNAHNHTNVVQKLKFQLYDQAGNVTRTVDATGKKVDFAYDIHNNKVGVRNGAGLVNVFDYDKNGQVLKQSFLRRENTVTSNTVTTVHGTYTNYTVNKVEYNGLNNSQTAGAKVQVNRFAYDQAGRRYAEYDAVNKAEYYRYDQRGNIVLKQNRVGAQTRTTYDDFNNKISEEQRVRLFSHNHEIEIPGSGSYGGSAIIINPVYADVWLGDQWQYSHGSYSFGRLNERTYVVRADNASSIHRNTLNYTYNRFGEVAKEAAQGNNTQFVQYDYWQNGLLKSKTDQQATNKNTTSTFNYDIRGLKTRESHTSTDTVSYTSYGQTYTSNTSTNVRTFYAYDALGRLTIVSSPAGTFRTAAGSRSTANLKDLSYRYDEWGNRRAIIAKYRLTGSSSDRTTSMFYKYDAEGRVLVNEGFIAGGKIVAGRNGGTEYTYDGAGRIATAEKWLRDEQPQPSYGISGGTTFTRSKNFYNGLGLLERVAKTTVKRAFQANTSQAGTVGQYANTEIYHYDNRGFRTNFVVDGARTLTSYRDDGQVVGQTTRNRSNQITSVTENYRYSAGGQLEHYDLKNYDNGSYRFTNSYHYTYTGTYTGTQVSAISVISTQGGTAAGRTFNYYDYRGRLTHSSITETNRAGNSTGFSQKYFAYNADDQIIGSHYRQFGESRPKVQSFVYYNNSNIADFGDEGVNITPIDSVYRAGGTPGSYTINAGDTLTNIAQALFGDSSLWYVLAEANALNLGPTDRFTQSDAGRSLRVPNTDQALRNNSTTFKPYNPGDIIGDLTPDPTILPPPKSGGCNIIATILIVVVAVVVTVVTAGAAAVLLSGAQGSLWAAGTTALAGGTAAAGGVAAGAVAGISGTYAAAAAAIGGFVGSLASQAVGVGLGVQDKISLRSAFSSGLTSAFTAGVGAVASGAKEGSAAANVANKIKDSTLVRGAATYVAAQASNRLVGLDTSFSWRGLAASAVGSYVGNGLADELTFDQLGEFGNGFTRSFLTGAATSKFSEQWAGGAPTDFGRIALDAFGNQLANSFVNSQSSVNKRSNTAKLQDTPAEQSSSASSADSASPATTAQSRAAKTATVAADDRIDQQRANSVTENVRGVHNGEPILEVVTIGYRDEKEQSAQFFFDGQRLTNQVRNGFDRDGDAIYVDRQHLASATAAAREVFDANIALARSRFVTWSDAEIRGAAILAPSSPNAIELGLGAAEIFLGGAYNGVVDIVGGAASVPYLLFDGVDAALAVQEGFSDAYGYNIRSQGAQFIIDEALAPVGEVVGDKINQARRFSESHIGIGATALLFTGAEAGLEIAALLTGTKAIRNAVGVPKNTSTVRTGGGCFLKGTLVHTENGLLPIEDVKVGLRVLAQPEEQGETAYKTVVNNFVFQNKNIWELVIEDEMGQLHKFMATENHPFWIDGIGWRRVDHIAVGQLVELSDKRFAKVVSVKDLAYTATVYNFEVEDYHTYYVGGIGVWVHNTRDCLPELDADGNRILDLIPATKRIEPTGEVGGVPIGPRNPQKGEGVRIENESVELLARFGFRADRTPIILRGTKKAPDVTLEGVVFDVLAPNGGSSDSLVKAIQKKTNGVKKGGVRGHPQTRNLVINTQRSPLSLKEIRSTVIKQRDHKFPTLDEVIFIDGTDVSRLDFIGK